MSRINIYERDLTTAVVESDITDVVYIPGFASARLVIPETFSTTKTYAVGDEVTKDGKYYKCILAVTQAGEWNPVNWEEFQITSLGVEVGVPTLCTTIAEFEAAFGTTAPTFYTDQACPSAFDGKAKSTTPWFLAGEPDPSYVYAKELIYSGLPVLYERMNYYRSHESVPEGESYDVTVEDAYAHFTIGTSIYDKLTDKGTFQFKYLTSGGYPAFEFSGASLANKLASVAASRGDCVALIDHTDKSDRPLTGTDSVYASISGTNKLSENGATFAAMFTPWALFGLTESYATKTMMSLPGSFSYLMCLAKSIKTNVNWLATAGISRGYVPNFVSPHTDNILTNNIAENIYQSDVATSINPITLINPTGYCIWGNRTLKDNAAAQGTTALSFLNIRNTVSDIKKSIYKAARNLMFEQNTDVLWIRFKAQIMPLLDRMKNGGGLKDYKIIKNTVNPDTHEPLPKSKLSAIVRLVPEYAVESFDIYIQLTDDDVTVE